MIENPEPQLTILARTESRNREPFGEVFVTYGYWPRCVGVCGRLPVEATRPDERIPSGGVRSRLWDF